MLIKNQIYKVLPQDLKNILNNAVSEDIWNDIEEIRLYNLGGL